MTIKECNDLIMQRSKGNKRKIATIIAHYIDPTEHSSKSRGEIASAAVNIHTMGIMEGIELATDYPEILEAYKNMGLDEVEFDG